ncbi:Pkinase-domain-containing protein [Thermothelomyces heterothallicus CBS 203.75]
MADPLGTLANVLAVLKLAAAATQYIKEAKNGASERLRLRDELRSTTCLLEMLKDRLEDGESAEDGDEASLKPPSITSLAAEDGPLALFKRVLEDIIDKLAPKDRLRRLAQPFTWPFDKKDVAELVATLERLKSHFNLIMQNDLVELAKLSHLKLDNIQRQVETATSRSLDNEAEKVILWISPLSYRARHLDVLNTARPGTGTWFLHHPVLNKWVNGELNVLWCPGIPGAGKTILACPSIISSLVIDNLERHHGSATSLCTYVYCSYEKRREQTPVALLSSILQQVLQQSRSSTLPEEVLSLYRLHSKHDTRPTLAQVTETLRAVTASFTVFRVIVDALDECAESDDDALRFISAVRSLGPSVRLLCTSRFSSVFERYFAEADSIEISARNEDIRIYLDSDIQQHPRLARHVHADPALKQDIIEAITGEFRGMFLLAKLHLESLSTKINRKAIRLALKTLPATLDATYSEAVQRIHNQAPDLVEVAKSVLFWVICAKRPLTVLELRQMYATLELPDHTPLEDDDLPDGELLTSTCGGLLLVEGEAQTVRVVHYTAQEYFERTHVQELEAARLSLANASLAYISLPNFSDGPCATDTAMARRLEQFRFLDYASRYWGVDIGSFSSAINDPVWAKLDSFFSNQRAQEVAWQVLHLPRVRNHAGRRASLAASRKGMLQVIRRLEADYRTVAERPLQRHTRIREEAEGSNSTVNGVAVSEEHQELTDPARPEEDDARDLPDWITVTNAFSKLFEFEATIGKGHFAEVCKYRNRVTNVAVAVKIFKYRPDARLSRMPYSLRNEVELLRKMQGEPHPAILNLIEVFLDFTRWQLLVVTELADAGDLFTLVVSKGKLSEDETRGVFAQLFSAVEFLHARGWVHRDIKPENILIFDQETLSLKLADFGLAKELPVDSSRWAYNATLCGTPSYVAPEVLAESQTRKCGTGTDIWSCGVVLYICLCGFPPFSDELKTEDFPYDLGEQIRRGLFSYPSPYWDPISDPALDLIDNMIVVDMAQRFSASQCLEHPWMTSTGH